MKVATLDSPTPGADRAPRRAITWAARLAAVAGAGYLAVVVCADGAQTLAALRHVGLGTLALGLALTLASLAVRAGRWQMLLKCQGEHVPIATSATIYLAGIGMSATPGKLGETVRSALLWRHGVSVDSSLAAFFVDRLSDVMAMMALAFVGLWLAPRAGLPHPAYPAAALVAIASAAIGLRTLALRGMLRSDSATSPAGWRGHVRRLARSLAVLWRPRVALASFACSSIAFGLQAVVFIAIVRAIDGQAEAWQAVAVFAVSTLAGAASLIPGGLGAMELTLVALQVAGGAPAAHAAAAIAFRGITFWFCILLGVAALWLSGARATIPGERA